MAIVMGPGGTVMPAEGGHFLVLKQAIFNTEMELVILIFLGQADGCIETKRDAIDHNPVFGLSRLERYREGGELTGRFSKQ
jgi:hypothetical protein